jgi:DNA-binding transcriptional LysR family regulator
MQTRFTLRQLEYLVAVGQHGSVTLAAEQLSVSAPSVSSAISQLEAEFGLPLFVRKHAQGMSPTTGGRDLIAEAARVLDAARRLTEVAARHKGTVHGTLRVGCLSTFAQIVVPGLRKSFLALYPEIDFRQFERHQALLIEGLRDASLDIALSYDLAVPADLEFTRLAVLPPFAILPQAHPLAHRSGLTLAELAPLPMILLDLPLSADYFLSLFEAEGLKPRIAERTQDMAVAQSLVSNDLGYAIANFRPLTNRSPDGKPLAFVPLTGPVKPLRMGLMAAAGSQASLTVQAFADHCRKSLHGDMLACLTLPDAG